MRVKEKYIEAGIDGTVFNLENGVSDLEISVPTMISHDNNS